MEEKINLSLFEDFLESSSPAGYAKTLINIKNADENKETVAEKIDRISNLKDRIKEMSETKKKKNGDTTSKIIEKVLDYKKDAQQIFQHTSKVDKGKPKPEPEESIAERVKLRRRKLDVIKKKKENINNELFSYYLDYLNPVITFERLRDATDQKNKDLVKSINKKLTKLKNIVKNVPKDKISKVQENEKINDIVEGILELNSKKQSGYGLKILIPNQILSILLIYVAQLKARK